jgi:simple sugar transport system substrate-binding protein
MMIVDRMKRAFLASVLSVAFCGVAGVAYASPDSPVIGVVVKIGGIPWFNAMDAGIKKKGQELGVKAFMVGPTSADPALQVRAIEDLIAQKVDVIGVVPNDAEVLEPVLDRARAAGIKVITHESPKQKNADYDSSSRPPKASVRLTASDSPRLSAAKANMRSLSAR